VKLAMLGGARKHPYYWAGFILSGEDGPLTHSGRHQGNNHR
jgi:hypothetical protein